MTIAAPRRAAPLEIPEWILDLTPGSAEFDDAISELSDENRTALLEWLAAQTPDATFAVLGYEPTPKQWMLHDLPPWSEGGPWDLLYGGAAGGGKTKGLLMDGLGWAARTPRIELWYIRATYPELRDSFLKELEDISHAEILGADWNEGRHTLTFPNRATLKFRHAKTMEHADQMLSASCQGLYIDERTTMLPKVLEKLSMRVRSADPSLPIIGIRSGSNPGKVGHMDCKTKFVDPAPLGHRRIRVSMPSGKRADRFFIPAKIEDNPYLDPDYEDRLALLDPAIQRAYREGRWDYFEGMAFIDFDPNIHVVDPEQYPLAQGYPLGTGIDYGMANPFCALWGMRLPDSLIVVYRELYATELTPSEQAAAIRGAQQNWEKPTPWLDPACWARQPDSPKPIAGAPPKKSIAADYRAAGVRVERAWNDRLGGKALVHRGLRVQNDGRPRLVIYSTCHNLIRTLPNLPRDKNNPEDVDTAAEDHAYDGLRYLLGGMTGRAPRPARTYGDELRSVRAGTGRLG